MVHNPPPEYTKQIVSKGVTIRDVMKQAGMYMLSLQATP